MYSVQGMVVSKTVTFQYPKELVFGYSLHRCVQCLSQMCAMSVTDVCNVCHRCVQCLSHMLSFGLRALHHTQPNYVSIAELITCLLIAVCHTYVINMLHVWFRCRLLAVRLCTMYSHILNRDFITLLLYIIYMS